MEDEADHNQSINGGEYEQEERVLQFLDSMDSYLTLVDSLSSALRQFLSLYGWLELASARYSMGNSRVTGTLLDLKLHPAATTVQVSQQEDESPLKDSMDKQPQFTLSKWSHYNDENCWSGELEAVEEELPKKDNGSQLRRRGTSHVSDEVEEEQATSHGSPTSPLMVDDQVQKERSKSLSVLGTLVSPKLRSAQMSFETALETLVKVANMRSMMLSAHAQIQRDMEGTKG